MAVPGYSHNKVSREACLARIEGQVRGIQRMVDKDRSCIDILNAPPGWE